MRKIYKVVLAAVVCANDEAETSSFISDNCEYDYLSLQDISEIQKKEDLPSGWSGSMLPLDTRKSFKDPWHELSIEEVLKLNEDDSVSFTDLFFKYRELEKRLAQLEEKL